MQIEDLVKIKSLNNKDKLQYFQKNIANTKIGIMGGTFDPIHYAHLATAEFIRENYNLDKILFIPSGDPPHKDSRVSNKKYRYDMCVLATNTNKDFIVSDIEINRPSKTYTVDTLKELKEIYPDSEIYFITGADAICEIDTWKDVELNFKLATFIAATRPGISEIKSKEKIKKLKEKYSANILNVYVPSLDISSTYIRSQIRNEKSIKYLVPELVEQYIYNKQLYKNGEE